MGRSKRKACRALNPTPLSHRLANRGARKRHTVSGAEVRAAQGCLGGNELGQTHNLSPIQVCHLNLTTGHRLTLPYEDHRIASTGPRYQNGCAALRSFSRPGRSELVQTAHTPCLPHLDATAGRPAAAWQSAAA
eukprot:6618-Chlamydomonas_euryale.AAC.2